MTYATQADMIAALGEDELIELTDRSGAGTIDSAVLGAALTAADAEIDAYVGRVADLPLAHVPAVLTQIAVRIVRYRLSTDLSEGRVRVDYEDALHTLESIAKGLINLDLGAAAVQQQAERRVRGTAANPIFTAANLGSNWP